MKIRICGFIIIKLFLSACTVNPNPPVGKGNKIEFSTNPASSITVNSAISGGMVIYDGGENILMKGICWSQNSVPTVNQFRSENGPGIGNFTTAISILNPNTQYFTRCYVINASGTYYADIKSFKTISTVPSISTTQISEIKATSAISGGGISSDGGLSITSKGVCWSVNQNPTTANSKTLNGSGSGSFSSTLNSLTPNTKYYVRAYATNSIGTSYGSEISFITLRSDPIISTFSINSITSSSARGGGSVQSDGGQTLQSRGICWSLNNQPTISNYYSIDGNGIGDFTSTLNSLLPNSTYYVRAYAKTSLSTYYGNQVSFNTVSVSTKPILTSPLNNSTIRCCYINLKWEAVPNATGYEVYLAKVPYQDFLYQAKKCNGSNYLSDKYLNTIYVTSTQVCFDAGNSTYNGSWMWQVRAVFGSIYGEFSSTYNYKYTN